MLELIMPVGPSGCGKSTYMREHFTEEKGYTIISSDALRAELFGDENDQTHNGAVFDEMFNRTKTALIHGTSVVYDATNLNAKRRTMLIKRLNSYATFRAVAYVFATSPDECIRRRSQEGVRQVSEGVIWRQVRTFQMPYYNEGFDKIHVIHTEGQMDRWKYLKEVIKAAREMDQQNPHHKRYPTVLQHCLATENFLCGIDKDLENLGLFHDFGKVFTKTVDENGVGHFYTHENVSAYLYLLNDKSDKMVDFANVINWHMKHYSYTDESQYEAWLSKLPQDMRKLIALLNIADKESC